MLDLSRYIIKDFTWAALSGAPVVMAFRIPKQYGFIYITSRSSGLFGIILIDGNMNRNIAIFDGKWFTLHNSRKHGIVNQTYQLPDHTDLFFRAITDRMSNPNGAPVKISLPFQKAFISYLLEYYPIWTTLNS